MTEEQRIHSILAAMQATEDLDEIFRLCHQLPVRLRRAIMLYGVEVTQSVIRDDPSLGNDLGPVGH